MNEELQHVYNRMKVIENEYLQPQQFKQYSNYWLPKEIVENSKNVLSFGVHRDTNFEQGICVDNQNLKINCYDPTPDSVTLFERFNWPNKDKMTFYPIAYAKENGTMKFYYDRNNLSRCYSLLPLPQYGNDPAYIEVDTKNLKTIMKEHMPSVDIIKADIEGVWYDFCREILDNDISFKALLIEFEIKLIDNEKSLVQYKEILEELKEKGFELFLNKPRNACLSEAIIINNK